MLSIDSDAKATLPCSCMVPVDAAEPVAFLATWVW